jgi:hypothetical protein
MKKILVAFMFGLMALGAHAEATFEQIEGLIQQHNYTAAEQGLEVIIKNHPQSAKAFYAMAQAQAGLGNLEKAKKALDIATGLNPTLDFAPAGSVASLKEAITPQTKKIEAVEESHFWPNFAYFALLCGFTAACYFLYSVYARKRDEDEGNGYTGGSTPKDPTPRGPSPSVAPTTPSASYASSYTPSKPASTTTASTASYTPTPAPMYSAPMPTHTTVVNNNSGSSDFLTGVIVADMLNSHHHDTTRVVEREVVREVPAPSRSSSWDDDSSSRSSSRSSSWDDDSSSKKSSSWSSSSDDSSSSSWSSSSSDSSSSWGSDSSSSSSSDW